MLDCLRRTLGLLVCGIVVGCASDHVRQGTFRADAGEQRWYMTCGDPVCSSSLDAGGKDAEPGAVPCAGSQIDGMPCSTLGAVCGEPDRNCGSVLICADRDPKAGDCPM